MKKLLFLSLPLLVAGAIALTNNNIDATYADYDRPQITIPGKPETAAEISIPEAVWNYQDRIVKKYSDKYQYDDIEENGSYEGPYSKFTDIATQHSYLGYGYNVIASPYLDSDFVKMRNPIIDRTKIQDSTLVLDRKLYTNSKTYRGSSMSEFAQSYGGSFKIYGNYAKLFSGGLSLEFHGSSEEKEFYYFYKGVYNVRTFTLRMLETDEGIANMLSDNFVNDINSSMHPDTFFDKYGTHLILGAAMGGRMEVNETYSSKTVRYTEDVAASVNMHVKYVGSSINAEAEMQYSSSSMNENIETDFESKSLGGPSLDLHSVEDVWQSYPRWVESFNDDMSKSVLMGIPSNEYFVPLWIYADSEARRDELEQYFVEKADGSFDDLCGQYTVNTKRIVTAKTIEIGEDNEYENSSAGAIDGNKRIYTLGETARLTAKPSRRYSFEGWYNNDDTCISHEPTYSFVVDDDVSIKAKFKNQMSGKIDGAGTDTNPYLIKKYDQFKLIQYDLKGTYSLWDDISFYSSKIDPIPGAFNGTFKGNGRRVLAFKIERNFSSGSTAKLGLFEELGPSASVLNLKIVNSTISADQSLYNNITVYAGIVCGINRGKINDVDCTGTNVEINIKSSLCGTISGYSSGEIKECNLRSVKVQGYDVVGGLSGTLDGGSKTENCTVCDNGTWTAKSLIQLTAGTNSQCSYVAGGLCGYGYNCKITNCAVTFTKFSLKGEVTRNPAMGYFVGHLNYGEVKYTKKVGSIDKTTVDKNYTRNYFACFDGYVGKADGNCVCEKTN